MFCGVIASWKLECKCKRLLWKFLNITDVFDYLRFNCKTQGNEKPRKMWSECAKVSALYAENKVRFACAEQLWFRHHFINFAQMW